VAADRQDPLGGDSGAVKEERAYWAARLMGRRAARGFNAPSEKVLGGPAD
jgi:hypothetical protein